MTEKKEASKKPIAKRAIKKTTKSARTAKVASKKRTTASSVAKKKATTKKVTSRKTAAKSVVKTVVRKSTKKKPVAVKAVVKETYKPRYDLALAFILTLSAILLIGYTAKVVTAAEFAEPPGGPSEGNIPVTVWNRDASVIGGEGGIWPEKQLDTSINIDGQIHFGENLFEMHNDGVSEQLMYGAIHYLDGPSPYTYYNGSEDDFLRFDMHYSNYPTVGDSRTYERFSVNYVGSLYSAGSAQFASSGTFGGASYSMTQNSSSTYLLGGFARFDETNPSAVYYADPDLDYLLWLRTYDYTGSPDVGYSDRFSVDVSGDVWASGKVKADGCFGPTFVGLTTTGGQGSGNYRPQDVAGYYGANNRCAVDLPGSHVCTVSEILESIQCSEAGDSFRSTPDGARAWVNAGPPGHSSNYSDCEGWSSSAANSYARYWIFDTITGGRGTGVSCNTVNGIQFACCK